jgi:hypothetical protein
VQKCLERPFIGSLFEEEYAISKAYSLNAFPATCLIDKSGRIAVAYVEVVINKDNVATNVNSLLSER